MAKFMAQQEAMDEKLNGMKEYSRAALQAKLDARRKLREDKNKEDAMRKEMNGLSGKRVRCFFCLFVFFFFFF